MKIEMNDKTEMTATEMVLMLDQFGEELAYKIENGEIDDNRGIMGFARDKTVEYFSNRRTEENQSD